MRLPGGAGTEVGLGGRAGPGDVDDGRGADVPAGAAQQGDAPGEPRIDGAASPEGLADRLRVAGAFQVCARALNLRSDLPRTLVPPFGSVSSLGRPNAVCISYFSSLRSWQPWSTFAATTQAMAPSLLK